jgi:hypothetical protein
MSAEPRAVVWWAVVVCVGVLALWYAPAQARQLRSDVEAGDRSEQYRELQPSRTGQIADPRLFVAAQRLIPADARYFVMVGKRPVAANPVVHRSVRPFARYWLLPRRLTQDIEKADWILSYHADLRASGLRFERVIPLGGGMSLAEVGEP